MDYPGKVKKDDTVIFVDKNVITCPNKKTPLWNLHPKVYIELKKEVALCPYCGQKYKINNYDE
tara:strand:+ start:760 stop:948 length:189 start_codon:yes stop_codon:yes gene_type:complete